MPAAVQKGLESRKWPPRVCQDRPGCCRRSASSPVVASPHRWHFSMDERAGEAVSCGCGCGDGFAGPGRGHEGGSRVPCWHRGSCRESSPFPDPGIRFYLMFSELDSRHFLNLPWSFLSVRGYRMRLVRFRWLGNGRDCGAGPGEAAAAAAAAAAGGVRARCLVLLGSQCGSAQVCDFQGAAGR